jgi:hypothetical protein
MNLAKIKQALQYLPGSHDFRNLCKMDVEKVYNFERKVFAAELRKQQQQQQHHSDGAPEDNGKDVYYLEILGQAFLWHQIRCIAEVMFMVGRGWEEPTVIQELLNVEKYPGKPAYSLADEKPLVLHDCGYKDLHMVSSVANLWTVSCQLEQQWEEHTLAAARLRNCITSLSDFVVQKHDVADFCMAKMRERQKKHQRAKHCNGETGKGTMDESQIAKMLSNGSPSTETIEWSKSLVILRSCDLIPDSQGLNTAIHVPLMLRSKGTTYEEKVEALKKSAKRREKFEENIVKKRKTAEEDAAFYKHMTNQGGGTRSTT